MNIYLIIFFEYYFLNQLKIIEICEFKCLIYIKCICYFEELMLEWIIKLIHPLNIQLIYLTLEVFHFDISGNDINELHSKNIKFIYLTLEVFHFDKSGNDINELHPLNIQFISLTLEIFHFDISGNDINELHLENI